MWRPVALSRQPRHGLLPAAAGLRAHSDLDHGHWLGSKLLYSPVRTSSVSWSLAAPSPPCAGAPLLHRRLRCPWYMSRNASLSSHPRPVRLSRDLRIRAKGGRVGVSTSSTSQQHRHCRELASLCERSSQPANTHSEEIKLAMASVSASSPVADTAPAEASAAYAPDVGDSAGSSSLTCTPRARAKLEHRDHTCQIGFHSAVEDGTERVDVADRGVGGSCLIDMMNKLAWPAPRRRAPVTL